MQTARIVQTVALMLIVAMAASCSASKEYSSKLFAPRTLLVKDSAVAALRFLETDSAEKNTEDWVTTDIIMGRDTANKSMALDNFSRQFPATPPTSAKPDSTLTTKESKDVFAETKIVAPASEPVVIVPVTGTGRTKKIREE